MSRKTRYFKKKLTATTSQQIETLPRFSSMNVLNYGNQDVYIEFENDLDASSVILPVRGSIPVPVDMLDIRYKVANGEEATIFIYGFKHEKS